MSWSINLIGKPENISVALDEKSKELDGKSKEEFDEALPNLKALITMNKSSWGSSLQLIASGHVSGEYSSCFVEIKSFGGTLV